MATSVRQRPDVQEADPDVAVRRGRGVWVLVGAFVASRLAFAAAGVQFDRRALVDSFQMLDPQLLEEQLLQSILHLHAQPPLLNLYAGTVMKLFGANAPWAFFVCYLLMGLGVVLCLYALLGRLGVPETPRTVLALAVGLSPSIFLFEYWPLYEYPLVLMLSASALVLHRWERDRRGRDAAAFFVLLAAVVLLRSMFHVLWLLLWVALLYLSARADWRRVTALALLPVAVVMAVHLNNLRTVGSFTTSTWLGMSFAKITTFQLSPEERQQMVDRGQLSELALVEPFSPLTAYDDAVASAPETGVAALDSPTKPGTDPATVGKFATNFNHLAYVEMSEGYLADSLATLRLRPDAYVQGLGTAIATFFRPASDFFALAGNRERVEALDTYYNVAIYGVVTGGEGADEVPRVENAFRQVGAARVGWLIVAAYGIALLGGGWLLARALRRGRGHSPLTIAFLWTTPFYVAIVGNLLEVGENNRFRMICEPLVVALLATLVVHIRAARLRRVEPAPGQSG